MPRSTRTLISPLALLGCLAWLPAFPLRALEVTAQVPSDDIQLSASGAWPGSNPRGVVDGGGLGANLLHDNDSSTYSKVWHTQALAGLKASSPAAGLPEGIAWLRCDFKRAQTLDRCVIWNLNQTSHLKGGFRRTLAFASADGKTFEPVKVDGREEFIIPQAKGAEAEPVTFVFALPSRKPIQSVILLAKDNYGGDVCGLSEVQFLAPTADVDAATLPAPAALAARDFPFISGADGAWRRQVAVDTGNVPVYEAVDATVTCDGATETTHWDASPRGRRVLLANLPAGKGNRRNCADKVTVTLRTGHWTKTTEAQLAPLAQWPDLEEVVVTWKCHLDIGYTHTVPEVVEKYRTKDMDQLLAMFDQTKDQPKDNRFLWMLPAWAMEIVLGKGQDPRRLAQLEQAVRDGRLIWHALPYTFEAEAADAEELVRGLGYATRTSKRFGMPLPTDAKLTDMPDQAWILPTLLKNAGVNFVHIGANDGSKPDSELAKIPPLCWWEGADGSRVLLGYSPHYGWASILPPRNWPHKSWLALFVRPDNQGPPAPAAVASILAQARRQLPGVRVRFGRPGDFAEAILRQEKERPSLPVVRGDMPDTWVHGQMSCPQATLAHRHAATKLGTLGSLDTSLRAWGLSPADAAGVLAQGYDLGGFYAEHTWGINGTYFRGAFGDAWKKKWQAGGYKKFEDTYEYHMDYGRKAGAIADEGVSRRMESLAQGVNAEGPRVAVFNPLPWARDAQAEVALPAGVAQKTLSRVRDLATGKPVPFDLSDGATLRLAAAGLPPGGYRTYALEFTEGGGDAKLAPGVALAGNTLETSRFTATFDLERGGIASLRDKATGRELVDASVHVLGQFMHERFSQAEVTRFIRAYTRPEAGSWVWGDFGKGGMPDGKTSPYLACTPAGWRAQATRGPLGEVVTLTASGSLGLAKGHVLTFTFPRDAGCVDIGWSVTDKTPDPIPEGGWLCLPFKVETPAFRVGRTGGTIDPAKDIIFGANRRLMSVDRALTVRAGAMGAGMAAASADLPLWSLGEPGLWQYSPAYVPTRPELFVNLYNNMWNTNYPLWIGGSWKAQVRVWPVADQASEEQAVFTPSWEVRQPVAAGYADGKAGNLPAAQSGVALSRKGARVSAFCPNPDADRGLPGTLLRIWEQAGEGGEITVTLPAGFKADKAQPVNLRGEKQGDPVKVEDGRFTADLNAWSPKSWVLE